MCATWNQRERELVRSTYLPTVLILPLFTYMCSGGCVCGCLREREGGVANQENWQTP